MSHPTPPTKGEAGIYQKICITPNTPAHKDQHAQMLATTIHKSNTTPHHQSRATTRRPHQRGATPTKKGHGPVVSKPNSVSGNSSKQCSHTTSHVCCMHQTCLHYREQAIFTIRPRSPNSHTMRAGLILVVLLRKEVIQPHLPVRLPCYDFVPIADPTFDGSLHKG